MTNDENIDIHTTLEKLTGIKIAPADKEAGGRNVWGRIAYNRPGMLHVEVLPRDKQINDRVMATFTSQEMALSRETRYQLYRTRCSEIASNINQSAVGGKNVILLVSSNGYLTKTAKLLIEALL